MSGVVIDLQRAREARWDKAWHDRQERLMRLRCVKGHTVERRSASHVGSWMACVRCGLIEEII